MEIIGISGEAGSGKDESYRQLSGFLSTMGKKCVQLSFGSKIKDICTMMFGWDRNRLAWDFEYKESSMLDDSTMDPACELLGMSRRKAMQLIGTEAMRNGLHPDVWIIAMKLAIQNGEYNQYDVGFVTDCRYLNEIEFIRSMNGLLIKVESDSPPKTSESSHSSEHEWKSYTGWDTIIRNKLDPNKTPEDNKMILREKLKLAYVNYTGFPIGEPC